MTDFDADFEQSLREQSKVATRVHATIDAALAEDSWCHVVVPERRFEWFWMFLNDPRVARRLRGRVMRTVETYENEVSAQLNFPEFYERFRGAFHECLEELDWLETETGYLLLITNPHEILVDEPHTYQGYEELLQTYVVGPFAGAAREHARTSQDDGQPKTPLAFDVVLLCDAEHEVAVRTAWRKPGAPLEA